MSSSIMKVCDLLKIIARDSTMAQKHAAAVFTHTNNIIGTGINSTVYFEGSLKKEKHGSCHAEASAIFNAYNFIYKTHGRQFYRAKGKKNRGL